MSDDATGEKSGLKAHALNRRSILLGGTTLAAASTLGTAASIQLAQAQQPTASGRPPNILVIMGDDVGWFNIGAYHQGIMSGKTPNLDKLAAEGMRFTDYYAEASCSRHPRPGGHDGHRARNRSATPPDNSARIISAI